MNGKRLFIGVLCTIMLWTAFGCVSVSARKNCFGSVSDAVVIDGQVYLINKSTGKVYRVNVTHAEEWRSDSENEDD